MTATLNFSLANNVGRRLRINMTLDGDPWDIAATGYDRARLELRAPASNDRTSLVLTNETGTLVFDGSAIIIDIPPALASGLTPGAYDYDLILRHATDRPRRPLKGVITVEQGVTRW